MAQCDFCGSSILFGGKTNGPRHYCDAKCASNGAMVAASARVPDEVVRAQVAKLHAGPCPKCNGAGPVDVHTSHRVISMLVATSWRSQPQVSCKGCGTKARVMDTLTSLVLGWWGFPWGVIMTPIQVVRNVVGMFGGPDPRTPSAQLTTMVRMHLASNGQQARGAA